MKKNSSKRSSNSTLPKHLHEESKQSSESESSSIEEFEIQQDSIMMQVPEINL